jgi:hypothetical protein
MELLETYRMHTGEQFKVPISDQAQATFYAYSNRITERLQAGEFTPVERRFAKRWAENAWRVGLVLHGAENGKRAHIEPVEVSTARAAIALVSWYALQQLEVLRGQEEAREGDKELEVLNIASRHARINVRLVKKAGICATSEEAEKILEKLRQQSMLESYDHKGRGPSTRYYTRPKNSHR